MILLQELIFPIVRDIFDMEHISQEEDHVTIPLKQTQDNQVQYDNTYALLGESSGFLIDITYSQLNLGVKLNSVGQIAFTVSACYKEFCLDDIPDEQLETYKNQISVCLSDEELADIYPTLLKLFCDNTNIEDLRLQAAKSIPAKHMENKELFAEELTQAGYRCVWTSQDCKECVLASIEDCEDSGGIVKAYIF